MAEAFIGGLLKSGLCDRTQVRASDPSAARRSLMQQEYGIDAGVDNAAMASWADIIVLAVKPQICESVLAGLQSVLTRQLVISIAAGLRLGWICARVPEGVRVVRVMPNAPALVGAGMSAVAVAGSATPADMDVALRLCRAVGRAESVEEDLLDAVTGLSGSGPAFVFAVLEAMADGGVKVGLPRQLADRLAVLSALGAATMALQCGTTSSGSFDAWEPSREPMRAGSTVLREGAMSLIVAHAVEAAARRSQELGG